MPNALNRCIDCLALFQVDGAQWQSPAKKTLNNMLVGTLDPQECSEGAMMSDNIARLVSREEGTCMSNNLVMDLLQEFRTETAKSAYRHERISAIALVEAVRASELDADGQSVFTSETIERLKTNRALPQNLRVL